MASQRLGGRRHDEGEESHDVGNPYTLLATYQYDPYGNLLSSTGSVANPWRFAGGYFDSSTGLYKFGTRYYNPSFGCWSQQDPAGGSLFDPTSLNRYLYAGDDPVNFTDPSGAAPCILVADILVARKVGELPGMVGFLVEIISPSANIDWWGGTLFIIGGLFGVRYIPIFGIHVNSPSDYARNDNYWLGVGTFTFEFFGVARLVNGTVCTIIGFLSVSVGLFP